MPVAGMRLEIRANCKQDPNSNVASWLVTAVRTSSAGRYAYSISAAQRRQNAPTCAAQVVYPTDTHNSWVVLSNLRPTPLSR